MNRGDEAPITEVEGNGGSIDAGRELTDRIVLKVTRGDADGRVGQGSSELEYHVARGGGVWALTGEKCGINVGELSAVRRCHFGGGAVVNGGIPQIGAGSGIRTIGEAEGVLVAN